MRPIARPVTSRRWSAGISAMHVIISFMSSGSSGFALISSTTLMGLPTQYVIKDIITYSRDRKEPPEIGRFFSADKPRAPRTQCPCWHPQRDGDGPNRQRKSNPICATDYRKKSTLHGVVF